jgi:hypothetical protein
MSTLFEVCAVSEPCQNPQGRAPASQASAQRRRVPCAKSVPESDFLMPLGLALSEKQTPQITENTEK